MSAKVPGSGTEETSEMSSRLIAKSFSPVVLLTLYTMRPIEALLSEAPTKIAELSPAPLEVPAKARLARRTSPLES